MRNIAENLSTLSGKDATIRIMTYLGVFLSGVFTLAADTSQQVNNLPFFVHSIRFYISLETIIYIANVSDIIVRQFSSARLVLRITDHVPALYALWKFIEIHFKKADNTNEGSKQKVI